MLINLKKLRSTKQLTQKEAAVLLGISVSFVKKLEAGKKNPSIETVKKIADAFGCESINEVFHTTAS